MRNRLCKPEGTCWTGFPGGGMSRYPGNFVIKCNSAVCVWVCKQQSHFINGVGRDLENKVHFHRCTAGQVTSSHLEHYFPWLPVSVYFLILVSRGITNSLSDEFKYCVWFSFFRHIWRKCILCNFTCKVRQFNEHRQYLLCFIHGAGFCRSGESGNVNQSSNREFTLG